MSAAAKCQLKSPLLYGVQELTDSVSIPWTVNVYGSGWNWENGNLICKAGQLHSYVSTTGPTLNEPFCENVPVMHFCRDKSDVRYNVVLL